MGREAACSGFVEAPIMAIFLGFSKHYKAFMNGLPRTSFVAGPGLKTLVRLVGVQELRSRCLELGYPFQKYVGQTARNFDSKWFWLMQWLWAILGSAR